MEPIRNADGNLPAQTCKGNFAYMVDALRDMHISGKVQHLKQMQLQNNSTNQIGNSANNAAASSANNVAANSANNVDNYF